MKYKEKLYSIALASTALVLFLFLVSSTVSVGAAQSASPAITETQITTSGSAFSPDVYGDWIVWTDSRNGQYNYDIYMYDRSTSLETQITTNGVAVNPSIYGDRIVWSDYRNGEALGNIYMYDRSTSLETQITTNGVAVNPAIYGDRIVWLGDSNGYDIYIYDLSTSQETQITTSGSAYSPAIYGDRIVWTNSLNGEVFGNIYMYDLSTHKEAQITISGQAAYPAIYEDKIVWQDSRNNDGDGSSDIYMYDLSTSQETRITTSGKAGIPAIYDNRIVWQDWRNGEAYGNIYMYNLSTSQETQITTGGTAEYPAIYDDIIVWMNTEEQTNIEYKHDIYMGTIEQHLSAGTYAYITNSGDNTVSVIDTATNTVTATVNVGSNPLGVAINPAGTNVYVANDYDNTVSVIDTATNTVTDTVNVGAAPYGIAVSPDGSKVYVANYYGDSVSIIDTETNTVTAVVDLEGGGWSAPQGIAVSPDGSKVYVANIGSNTVSIIETASNAITATVTGSSPWGIAINPTGTKVYVTNYADGTVSTIDTAINIVTAMVAFEGDEWIGPSGIAVDPEGTKLYVTNRDSKTVSVIDTATNALTATVEVEGVPEGVAVNPDGTNVYVANKGNNTVSVINTATNTVTATVPVGNGPIAFGQFIGEIPVVPVEESGESTITVGQNASTPEITQKFNDSYYRNGGLSVLGNPSTEVHYAFGFEVQDFPEMPATAGGVIMYNSSNSTAYFIYGAIWDKYYAYPDANKTRLGHIASDEKVAAVSPTGTVGKYSEFENGRIHWISDKDGENVGHLQRGESFVTYGELDELYTEMKGTYSDLGFPIADQITNADGHDYCEFEGGNISWDASSGTYKVNYPTSNTPPTTNPVSVTNTESSTPTISWAYSDADNDPQQQYELEVWSGMWQTGTQMWSQSQSSMYSSVTYGGYALEEDKTYYVRVRAFDGTAWSEWSETSWNWIIDYSLSVEITSPSYEDQLIEDESTRFSCQVSGGVPPYTYEWRDRSGDIFSDLQNFDFNFYDFYDDNIKKFQPSGINDIRLTVTDATGAKGFDNVRVYVVPPPAQVEVAVYQDGKLVNNPIMNKPYEFRIKIKNVDNKPHYYSLKLKTPPEDNAPNDYIWDINPITTEIQNNVETQLIQPGETNVFTYSFKSNWVWITPEDKISRETMNAIAEVIIPTLGDVWNIEDIFEILTGNMVAQPKITFKFKPDELSSSHSIIYEGSSANAEVYVGNDKTIAFYEYLTDRSIELVGSLAAANTGNIYVFFSSPAAWIYSKYHYQKAIDPDPDYKVVVNPEPYNVPEIDSLPDGLHKDLAQMSFEMLSYNRAEVLSYVRYIAAEEDNAHEYELLQLEAVKKYNDMYLEKIDTINNIYRLIIQDQSPLTDVDVANIKNEIDTNGLPIEWISILTREGLENEIPNIQQAILDADNEIYKNPSLYLDNNVRDAELRANLSEEYSKEILEIKVNDLGKIPTEASPIEIGKLEKLKTDIQIGLDEGYATKQLKDDIKSLLDLANDLIIETNNNDYLHYYFFAMDAQVKYFTLEIPDDVDLPLSITNLQSTNGTNWINWTWTNPSDSDFNHIEIHLNGIFQTNTSAEFFNATGLEPETNYTIGTRMVDIYGNVNETWINATATTKKAPMLAFPGYTNPPTDLDQDGLYEDINGNEILDFDDVVAYYDNMEWIEENAPFESFDYNKNGLIDFDDVVKLYDML
jgi:YVTN family beta-propeller protein/beta propeller repeat protein